MWNFFRTLPAQPVATRKRFVILATAVSFLVVLLLWIGILSRTRRPPSVLSPDAPGVPAPTAATVRPGSEDSGTVGETVVPVERATPVIDVGQISTNLLKVFSPGPVPPVRAP